MTTVVSFEVVVDVSGIAVVCASDTVAAPVGAGGRVIVDPASVDAGDAGVSGAAVEAGTPPVVSCIGVDPVSVDAGDVAAGVIGVSGAAVEAVSAPPVVYGLAS